MTAYDLLAAGRVGVDLYPLQYGVPLEEVHSFEKHLGGSAANVAVAAARHGRLAGVVSATGSDAFGRFIRRELLQLGVDDAHLQTIPNGPPTPVTFCELFPPDHFPRWFYRYPVAPDLLIQASSIPLQAIREARVYWSTVTGLSQEPSRSAHFAAWEERAGRAFTVLDLDYRASFWGSHAEARKVVQSALPHVSVAVGNLEECEVATGMADAESAARALLAAGPQLAVVTLGARGALAMTADEEVQVDAYPVQVINGLGAGDAFGGALVHALLSGWDLERTLHFANVAAALVAGRMESSAAMPTTAEVQAVLGDVEVADGAM